MGCGDKAVKGSAGCSLAEAFHERFGKMIPVRIVVGVVLDKRRILHVVQLRIELIMQIPVIDENSILAVAYRSDLLGAHTSGAPKPLPRVCEQAYLTHTYPRTQNRPGDCREH